MSGNVNIPPELSAKFANMSIVCAALVVCMHVGGIFARDTVGWWISEFTRGGVSRVAVPYFFLASGYFLAGKFSFAEGRTVISVWLVEIRKRVRTLLVPLLIWPLIGMLWVAPFIMAANHLAGRPLGQEIPFMNGVYWPGVGILWFIKFLFILVMLSPAILFFIRRLGCVWLIIAFVVYWGIYTFIDPVNEKGPMGWSIYDFSLEGLAYFSTGIYIRQFVRKRLDLSRHASVWLLMVGVLGVLASIVCTRIQIPVGGTYLNLRHFPLPFLMAGMFGLMPTKRFPVILVSAAFPVYLMHGMWAVSITCVLNHIPFVGCTSAYVLKWGIAFGMSVTMAWVLRRFTPRVAAVLFGGR